MHYHVKIACYGTRCAGMAHSRVSRGPAIGRQDGVLQGVARARGSLDEATAWAGGGLGKAAAWAGGNLGEAVA